MRRSLHPFVSFSLVFFSFTAAIAGRGPVRLGAIVLLAIVCCCVPQRKKLFRKIAFYVLPMGIILVAVNRFFGLSLSESIIYAVRFVLLVSPVIFLVYTTPASKISLALRRSGIPSRLHYLFLLSFDVVETLRDLFRNVYIAQQLRGLRLGSVFGRWRKIAPLLFPVMLIAISQSLDRSLTLEFKGVERIGNKTYIRTLSFSWVDRLLIAALLAASLFIIFNFFFLR